MGKSDLPESQDYSPPKYALDLKGITEQVPGNKVILVGHIIGGMIIQEMYEMYPDFIKAKVANLDSLEFNNNI